MEEVGELGFFHGGGVVEPALLRQGGLINLGGGGGAVLRKEGQAGEFAVGFLGGQVVAGGGDVAVVGVDPVALELVTPVLLVRGGHLVDDDADVGLGFEELLDHVVLEEDVPVAEDEAVGHRRLGRKK